MECQSRKSKDVPEMAEMECTLVIPLQISYFQIQQECLCESGISEYMILIDYIYIAITKTYHLWSVV